MNFIKHITKKGTKDFSMFLNPDGGHLWTMDDRIPDSLIDLACDAGNLDLVKFCVETDKDCMDNSDGLRLAIENNDIEIIKYLLSQGCDIKDEEEGDTEAIHIACEYGRLECVKLLVEYGCLYKKGRRYWPYEGLTPLEVAKKHNKEDVVSYLLTLNK